MDFDSDTSSQSSLSTLDEDTENRLCERARVFQRPGNDDWVDDANAMRFFNLSYMNAQLKKRSHTRRRDVETLLHRLHAMDVKLHKTQMRLLVLEINHRGGKTINLSDS